MLEIFDIFGAHLFSLPAMKEMFDNKIISLKEEGNYSHVKQTYEKYAAPFDKVSNG